MIYVDTDSSRPGPEFSLAGNGEFEKLVYVNRSRGFDQGVYREGIDWVCTRPTQRRDAERRRVDFLQIPRRCFADQGVLPERIRVSAVSYRDERLKALDWAPGVRTFARWVRSSAGKKIR